MTGGRADPRHRRRDAERARPGVRPGRDVRSRSRRIPIEPYVSPQPGWAEQDPELYWRTLGDACRRVLADPAVRRDAIAGLALTDPAQHGRRDRRGRPAAATGDRLARPAPDRRPAVVGGADRARLPGARAARHRRRLHGRLRGELAARQRARDVGRDPPLPAPVGLPRPSADRAVRRFDRVAGRLPAVRLQAPWRWAKPATGNGPRRRSTRPGCPSSCPRPTGSAS